MDIYTLFLLWTSYLQLLVFHMYQKHNSKLLERVTPLDLL